MIRLYIVEGLSLERIGAHFSRSSRTPLLHIQKHNITVKKSGFCPVCRRVGSIYEGEIAKKKG